MISMITTWDQRGSLGIHLCQKDPKSVKKWLSYGYFLTERLLDSIENHMGQKGMLGHSFVPKISKIGQDLPELLSFSPERLRDSIENHMGQKSKIQIAIEMAYFGLLRIMMGDLGWWGLIQGFPLKDIKSKKG